MPSLRALLIALALSACATTRAPDASAPPPPADPDRPGGFGVLVMAHGGDAIWNERVAGAVAPLAAEHPTVVAFGMADPGSLARGLDSLRTMGVGRVSVVRMFLSGASFRQQTRYLLGLSAEPPESFLLMGPAGHHGGGHGPDPLPIDHGLEIRTHAAGLLVSEEARDILRQRALGLASTPHEESVLLLAHGMGDEGENEGVLQAMRVIADDIGRSGFSTVRVATLREDWEEKREEAEASIRRFVAGETALGRRTLVIPVRLAGFGPYAEVLDGLEYVAGEGLLPHEAISSWIRRTATEVACEAGWHDAVAPCPTLAAAR